MEDEPAGRSSAGLLQSVVQQPVGVSSLVLRAEEVGAVEEHGIDVSNGDEVLDIDDLGAPPRGRLDLVPGEDDVLVGRDLEALDDLRVGDLLVLFGAEATVLDACPVGQMHLSEADRLGLHG
ncbi:MAG: hypothetical protein KY433_12935 [Actinobacteria bacterium]|nr:hypothetical protein [Actinomycetota bacterium]